MSAAFLDEFRGDRSRCAKCKCDADLNDLTPLGHLGDICAKCFHEVIADMRLTSDEWRQMQDKSGGWEE